MPGHNPRRPLNITPTPFKSSFLAVPPSPFSPRTPLHTHKNPRPLSPSARVPPSTKAPSSPLAWVWTCHQCHRSYHLGVTRRCLDDGHRFCAGTTTVKQWRKPASARRHRRHRACASEFDYHGWKTWSRWREGGQEKRGGNLFPGAGKDCWRACSYPSECRWGLRFGVHTPLATEFSAVEVDKMTALPVPNEQEDDLEMEMEKCEEVGMEKEKGGFWEALSAAARRRASVVSPSPLAGLAEATPGQDGDVGVTPLNPGNDECSEPGLSVSSSASGAIVVLKHLMRRKRRRGLFRSGRIRTGVVPTLTTSTPAAMLGEDEADDIDPEALLYEYAPLERMCSQDRRYMVHSN